MGSYRVYWVNPEDRIIRGEWIEAEDDEDARRQAANLCTGESSAIEIWEAQRPVDQIECKGESGPDRRPLLPEE